MEFVVLIALGLLILFIAKGIATKAPGPDANAKPAQDSKKQVKRERSPAKAQPKEPYTTIKFRYRDRDGNETKRTVDFVIGKRGETFRAFCHLRKEERTFFFDRIVGFEVIDVASGETLTPMEWKYKLQGTKVALAELEREREIMQSMKEKNA